MASNFKHIIDQLKIAPDEYELAGMSDGALQATYMFWLGVKAAFTKEEAEQVENLQLVDDMNSYIDDLREVVDKRGILDDLTKQRLKNMGLIKR